MAGSLAWPPRREDLERLYLVEHLSAAKIARIYELKYKTPKVAESVVLYQLKKNGIPRRDSADHIRKVASQTVDEWVTRYQAGESLKQIAGDAVSPVTVWLHLRKRGVQLRDKVDAQIQAVSKYERGTFKGNRLDRVYLLGLRYGDLDVVRHGRAIRVRVSTTRPAMAKLFESLFAPYGHVARYPRTAAFTGYEWNLECDLNRSFEFLLPKPSIAELERLPRRDTLAFLAGLFDAEGSVLLHNKRGRYNPEVTFSNTEEELLQYVSRCLTRLGVHCKFGWQVQPIDRGGITGPSRLGHLNVWRFHDVQHFLRMLPIRHADRVGKSHLVLQARYRSSRAENSKLAAMWAQLTEDIKRSRDAYVETAHQAMLDSGHGQAQSGLACFR